MPANIRLRHGSPAQQGVALVLALVFLLLLTLIGITALGTSSIEEKMASNVKDKNLAFQAAESAVLLAENWLVAQLVEPPFSSNSGGLYKVSSAATPVWESVDWSGSNVVAYPNAPYGAALDALAGGAGGSLGKIQTQPKYLVEELVKVSDSIIMDSPYQYRTILRVTARGTGGTDAATVMTQSAFSWAWPSAY